MKILFSIKALDGISGGAERVLADVTAALCDTQRHDISILTFDAVGGSAFYPLDERIERICLGIGNTKKESTLWEMIKRIVVMRKMVKQSRPDVVVAFMHSMFVPMSISLIGTGIPIIASEHIIAAHYKKRGVEFFLFKISSFFIDKITVLSERIKRTYPIFLQKKMVAISNPVIFPKNIDANKKNKKRKTILAVGRLYPQKNQALLVDAFAQLVNKYPEWDLKIIGEGVLRESLEMQVNALGLNDRIFLPGTTTDISSEYINADIFALPSSYESFGLATAEALAHGLPAIGFADCEGTNELIEHEKNGILVSGNNQSYEFSLALEKLITNESLRAGYGSYGKTSVQKFSIKYISSEWEKLLTSLNKVS